MRIYWKKCLVDSTTVVCKISWHTSTFCVDVTIRIVISRIWIGRATKNVALLSNKLAVAYFTSQSSRFSYLFSVQFHNLVFFLLTSKFTRTLLHFFIFMLFSKILMNSSLFFTTYLLMHCWKFLFETFKRFKNLLKDSNPQKQKQLWSKMNFQIKKEEQKKDNRNVPLQYIYCKLNHKENWGFLRVRFISNTYWESKKLVYSTLIAHKPRIKYDVLLNNNPKNVF